jgi:Mg/Co/Ni transporter MgtE
MPLQLDETTSTLVEQLSKLNTVELKHFIETLTEQDRLKLSALLTPKMSKYIPKYIIPSPKQLLFLLATNREILFGGSAGGVRAS